MSNCLYPGQDRHSVGRALGPNCLQMLSAADKNHCTQGKSKDLFLVSTGQFRIFI